MSPLVLSPRSARRFGSISGDESERAISPQSSVLREERARLLEAAKQVAKEIQESEIQAREQDAVVQIIREELREKAMSPRAAGSTDHSRGAAHDAPPANPRRDKSQEPVIQRALPLQTQFGGSDLSPPSAGHRHSSDAATPAGRNSNTRTKLLQEPCTNSGHGARTPGAAQHDAGSGMQDPGVPQLLPDGHEAAGRDVQNAQLEAGVQSLLEMELQVLLIMQFSVNGTSVMRSDLTRSDLLRVCRNDIDPDRAQGRKRGVSKSTSVGQLAELKRVAPLNETDSLAAADADAASRTGVTVHGLPNLHLRDLRYLQGMSNHHLMPRRGALVVSLGLINAVITHRNAYFVIPDGADKLLQVRPCVWCGSCSRHGTSSSASSRSPLTA